MSDLLATLLHEEVTSGKGILGTSFAATPGPLGSSDFLASIMLPPWVATDWTFTAKAWGFQGTPGGGAGTIPNYDTFQPTFAAPSAFPGSTLDLGLNAATGPLLRFTWGTGNVLETAWCDYPISGLTVGGLHGSTLRVNVDNLISTPATGVPILGGWATPGVASGKRASDPVLTYAGIAAVAGTTISFFAPPRARAYRVYSPDSVTGNNWWNTGVGLQAFAGATPIARDYDLAQSNWSTVLSEGGRMLWMPLDPRATRILLSTTGTVSTCTIGVQWLIDLG